MKVLKTELIDIHGDLLLKQIIEISGFKLKLRYYPKYMCSSTDYTRLAKELKDAHKTFWSNSEVDWRDCIEDVKSYLEEFFQDKDFLESFDAEDEDEN